MKFIILKFCVLILFSSNLLAENFLQFEQSWPVSKININPSGYGAIFGDGINIYLVEKTYTNPYIDTEKSRINITVLSHEGFVLDIFGYENKCKTASGNENIQARMTKGFMVQDRIYLVYNCSSPSLPYYINIINKKTGKIIEEKEIYPDDYFPGFPEDYTNFQIRIDGSGRLYFVVHADIGNGLTYFIINQYGKKYIFDNEISYPTLCFDRNLAYFIRRNGDSDEYYIYEIDTDSMEIIDSFSVSHDLGYIQICGVSNGILTTINDPFGKFKIDLDTKSVLPEVFPDDSPVLGMEYYIDNESGYIYGLDYMREIRVFDADFNVELFATPYATKDGHFNGIWDIRLDQDILYIKDELESFTTSSTEIFHILGRMQSFDLEGDYLSTFVHSDYADYGFPDEWIIDDQIYDLFKDPFYSINNSWNFLSYNNGNEVSEITLPKYPDENANCNDIPENTRYGSAAIGEYWMYVLDDNTVQQCNESQSVYKIVRNNNQVALLRPAGVVSMFDDDGNHVQTFSLLDKIYSQGMNIGFLHSFWGHAYSFDSNNNLFYAFADRVYKISLDLQEVEILSHPLVPEEKVDLLVHGNNVFITSPTHVYKFSILDQPMNSKALIVAGGDAEDNLLWDEVQANANHAFFSLLNQGYDKSNIRYLSRNTDLDLDSDGEPDIYGAPTQALIQEAITEWASGTEDLVIYLVGHGGDKTFELGGGQLLQAGNLDGWLDTFQADNPGRVMVIYDACQSGSFQQPLSGSGQRYVLTSAAAGQNAYFQGAISFSHLFWDAVIGGKDIPDAFEIAQEGIQQSFADQTPLLDTNGNGITNEPDDDATAAQQVVGNTQAAISNNQRPEISNVQISLVPDKASTATISAYVSDDGSIQKVWAQVIPPYINYAGYGGIPITNMPRFTLTLQEDGTYQGSYDGFDQPGQYKVVLYAKDQAGSVAIPQVETWDVESPVGRKALVVAGYAADAKAAGAIRFDADYAYDALVQQGYAPQSIRYLTAYNQSSHRNESPLNLTSLQSALLDWSGRVDSTSDLVVYLVGDSTVDGRFPLSSDGVDSIEYLLVSQLNGWLNTIQPNIQGTVTVIQEGHYSGNLVKWIDTFENKSRVVISSSSDTQASSRPNRHVSFSRYFWNRVARGGFVDDAFREARARMRRFQHAQINMDGDRRSNHKEDIRHAYYRLGFGIVLAADEPEIGQVTPNIELQNNQTSAGLWAGNIYSLAPLHKVWAVIEPPEYDPANHQTGELVEIPLTDEDGDGRWEATADAFTRAGDYAVHYYAMDNRGYISAPLTHYVTQTQGADAYEVDDGFDTASLLSANTHFRQWHNFHQAGDVDYIRFYADPGNGEYTIKVDSTGSQVDAVFAVYEGCDPAKAVTWADGTNEIDDVGADSLERAYWRPSAAGYHCLKVRPYDENSVHADKANGYTASVFPTNAPGNSSISVVVKNAITGSRIAGARVYLVKQSAPEENGGNLGEQTNADGVFYTGQVKQGSYNLVIEAAGYQTEVGTFEVTTDQRLELDDISLTPDQSDRPNPPNGEDKAVRPIKLPKKAIKLGSGEPVVMHIVDIGVPEGGGQFYGMQIESKATGGGTAGIEYVSLYHDTNQNKVADSGEEITIAGARKPFPSGGNGTTTFTLETPYPLPSGQQQIMVVYER